ncbi:MAG: hypothetical protein AAF743_02495 [Planctomycetota bacterium]
MTFVETLEQRKLLAVTTLYEGAGVQEIAFAGDRVIYTLDQTDSDVFAINRNGSDRTVIDNSGYGSNLVSVGDKAFFVGSSSSTGVGIFETNGTPGGTRVVADASDFPDGGASQTGVMDAFAGKLLYADTPNLLAVDPGNGSFTTLIDGGVAPDSFNSFFYFTFIGPSPRASDLYFFRVNETLWAIDGNAESARAVGRDTGFDAFRPIGKSAGKHVLLASTGFLGDFDQIAEDGALIVTSGKRDDVVLYDLDGDGSTNDQFIEAATILPDGTVLVSGSNDDVFGLWRARSVDDTATLIVSTNDFILPLITVGNRAVFGQGVDFQDGFGGSASIYSIGANNSSPTLLFEDWFFEDFEHVVQGNDRLLLAGRFSSWLSTNGTANGTEFVPDLPINASGEFVQVDVRGTDVVFGDNDNQSGAAYLATNVLPGGWAFADARSGTSGNSGGGNSGEGDAGGGSEPEPTPTFGRVAGVLFEDRNRDGIQQVSEEFLDGFKVFADYNGNNRHDADEPSDRSDDSGEYALENVPIGDHSITILYVNDGQLHTTPRLQATSVVADRTAIAHFGITTTRVTIRFFIDDNDDGVRNPGEADLVDDEARAFLDASEDGDYNKGERLAEVDADNSSTQRFRYLPPGEYRFDSNVANTSGGVRVTLKPGQSLIREIGIPSSNSNEQPAPDGPVTVSGRLFADLNANDRRDPGEPTLDGFRLFPDVLKGDATVRSAASGRFTAEVPAGSMLDVTSALGLALAPGSANYTVPEVGVLELGNIPMRHVQAALNPVESGTSSLFGFAFRDLNGDRKRTDNETNLDGYRTYLDRNGNGKFDPGETSTRVSADGSYRFEGLAPGLYRLRMTTFPGDDSVDLWDGREASALGRDTWIYVNGDTYRTLALQT